MQENNKQLSGTTPVPNGLFDEHLPKLKSTELKLLLIIIRQTWGWRDPRTQQRKTKDWISGSQLRRKTGCSRRALTDATSTLIKKKLIQVTGEAGLQLRTAEERKGKLRMFYRFQEPSGKAVETQGGREKTAQQPTQKLPITKETVTKEVDSNGNYRFTENDIELFQKELKQAGSMEQLLQNKEAIYIQKGERTITVHEDGITYREKHLKEYSLPGVNTKNLRTPYSLWMTLYHRTKR
ncbi:MAG: replication protein [Flavobacteriales bacterium]|nr:replication protein [Flavobacteriales bacterium]